MLASSALIRAHSGPARSGASSLGLSSRPAKATKSRASRSFQSAGTSVTCPPSVAALISCMRAGE